VHKPESRVLGSLLLGKTQPTPMNESEGCDTLENIFSGSACHVILPLWFYDGDQKPDN
jgi:hypothetical protein